MTNRPRTLWTHCLHSSIDRLGKGPIATGPKRDGRVIVATGRETEIDRARGIAAKAVRRAMATGPTAVPVTAKGRAARGGVRMDRLLAVWSSGSASSNGGSMRWSVSCARSAAIGGRTVVRADPDSADPDLDSAGVISAGSAGGLASAVDLEWAGRASAPVRRAIVLAPGRKVIGAKVIGAKVIGRARAPKRKAEIATTTAGKGASAGMKIAATGPIAIGMTTGMTTTKSDQGETLAVFASSSNSLTNS